MTIAFLGEYELKIGRRYYILRPSLRVLLSIESRAGITLPQIIGKLDNPEDGSRLIHVIIQCGVLNPIRRLPLLFSWERLRRDALTFLLQGMGYSLRVAGAAFPLLTEDEKTQIKPLDWHVLYKTATVLLGKSEQEFWAMTVPGILLQCEAYASVNGVELTRQGTPATKSDLRALMGRYPDQPVSRLF